MDNFKYSVKTQQFGKKRHQIFTKEAQKQSMSLQVHEPCHNVSHLLSLTKSEQQNTLTQFWKQPSEQYQIYESVSVEQQKKTVEFNKPNSRRHSTSQQSRSRTKIHHDIAATAKVSIPVGMQSQSAHASHASISSSQLEHPSNKISPQYNPQQPRPAHINAIVDSTSQNQLSFGQLQEIKVTLLNNEQKLQQLTCSLNSLYKSAIDLYSNHELKMKELVNHRCYQILNIFKSALIEIQTKQREVQEIDSKVDVLINTVKDSKEILRIVKIKQECIEAMQKSKQVIPPSIAKDSQKKSALQMQFSSSAHTNGTVAYYNNNNNNTASLNTKQTTKGERTPSEHTKRSSCNIKEDNNCSLDFSLLSNKPNEIPQQCVPSRQFVMITCSAEDDSASVATSFIHSPKKVQAKELSEFKKSPFEANQLFQISNTMPSIPKIHQDLFIQKESEYSFRKPVLNNYENFYQPRVRNERQRESSGKAVTSQPHAYERLKKCLSQLMQSSASKEVWLDKLQCLRRKNGTYLLDAEGNAVICSQLEYEKLLKDGVISATIF